jgi:nucleotide-binding universal stress UspA family protein
MAYPIVVGVDTTSDSLAALAAAARLAQQAAAPLIAVHVRHEPILTSEVGVASEAAAMDNALDEMEAATRQQVAAAMAGSRVDWRFVVTSGDPATALIKNAVDHGATTIVVGGRNHGVVGGMVLGSVAQKLVRRSPVSVLVVRDGETHRVSDQGLRLVSP